MLLHEQLHVEPSAPEELRAGVYGCAIHSALWCWLRFRTLCGRSVHWRVLDMLVPLPLGREDHVAERTAWVCDKFRPRHCFEARISCGRGGRRWLHRRYVVGERW